MAEHVVINPQMDVSDGDISNALLTFHLPLSSLSSLLRLETKMHLKVH